MLATEQSRGCFLTPTDFRAYRRQGDTLYALTDVIFQQSATHNSTGNKDLDRELNRALKTAADTLSVNPAFGFFDPDKFLEPDLHGLNAFAWDRDVAMAGTQGLVGFGKSLFRNELFAYDDTGATIMAIVAHEFGHIVQYQRGYLQSLPVLQCELHADFMSGYYLGTKKLRLPSFQFARAEELFFRIGRSGEGNPNRSHGNSAERVTAAHAGYTAGYAEQLSLENACMAGLRFVASMPPPQ